MLSGWGGTGGGGGNADDDDDDDTDIDSTCLGAAPMDDDTEQGGGKNRYGPYTRVVLWGWGQVLGSQCSWASFLPIFVAITLVADTVLAIFAGLDLLDRGTGAPWVQFSLSIAIAAVYLALTLVALVQYRWERVLRFRYHWILTMGLCAILAWTNFGVWASWQGRFASFAGGISSSDGTAFVAWVGANAVGLAGFFARLVTIAMGQGLRYTYSRAVELSGLIVSRTSGGRNLPSVLTAGSQAALYRNHNGPHGAAQGASPPPAHGHNDGAPPAHMARYADTHYWAVMRREHQQQQQQSRNGNRARRHGDTRV